MLSKSYIDLILKGIVETLYMTGASTLIGYLIGLPIGIILTVTDTDGIRPNSFVYRIFDFICNIVRSIPFLILMILLIPMIKLILGKSYGPTAAVIALIVCAAPYIGRLVESSLKEVDYGVIEAAKSMGASNLQIIFKVLLVEARVSLIINATIATGNILGYTAIAGSIGAGGLGSIAIQYGYNRWKTDIMFITVILLIILFQIIQMIGMKVANRLDRRK